MAVVDIGGPQGLYYPPLVGAQISGSGIPGVSAVLNMTASGSKCGWVGSVLVPGGGTKSVTKVHFRTGALTTAGGTDLQVSFQLPSTTTAYPDGTVLGGGSPQSVTIDGTTLTANAANEATLDNAASLTNGDTVAVVFELVNYGGADSMVIGGPSHGTATYSFPYSVLNNGSWSAPTATIVPLVVFEFSDGTFGGFAGGVAFLSGVNTHTFNSSSSPSERGLVIVPTAPLRICGAWGWIDADGDFTFNLYAGTSTTPVASSGTQDKDNRATNAARPMFRPFTSRYTLQPGTTYYLSIKPETTTNLTAYSFDYAAAGHRQAEVGGDVFAYSERSGGAWDSPTTTRRLLCGLVVDGLDDGAGAGGGAGPLVGPGRLIR